MSEENLMVLFAEQWIERKLFTVEKSLQWYGYSPTRYSVGAIVTVNKKHYNAGDIPESRYEILGIEIRKAELNDKLTLEGYTHEEVYRVKGLDSGKLMVLWPDEVSDEYKGSPEVEKLEVPAQPKTETVYIDNVIYVDFINKKRRG